MDILLADKLIIGPHSFFYLTICITHFASSVKLIILELSLISVTIEPGKNALTCSVVIEPITCILIPIGKINRAFSIGLVILELSLVSVTIEPGINALTCFLVI